MATNIEMPKLSETMSEGILLRWNKQIGDFVDIGEIIAEVETDKATISIECFDDGYLIETCAEEGQKVPVGATIAVLDTTMPQQQTAVRQAPTAAQESPVWDENAIKELPRRCISSLARKLAIQTKTDVQPLSGIGSGPRGRIMSRDVAKAQAAQASLAATPAQMPAHADLPKAPAPAAAVSPAPAKPVPASSEDSSLIPLSQRQKFVAAQSSTSKSTTPHFYMTVEVDVTQLAVLRDQINKQAERTHGHHYTINDFVMKAIINACKIVPAINASFDEEKQGIILHKHIDINVAVDVNKSVLIPLVKGTQEKTILQISNEIRDMAARAKENKLRSSDFGTGTITLSNLGAVGVSNFFAIINTPQAAIVTVGAVTEKPVVRRGSVTVGRCMSLSVSCDHRVITGPEAARFLGEARILLETPSLLLV